MDIDSQPELTSGDPKNDLLLEELCLNMLERAAMTRNPGDQITVGAAGCELAAVVHFVEAGRAEEFADWFESIDVYIQRDEDKDEPNISWEQLKAEIDAQNSPEGTSLA